MAARGRPRTFDRGEALKKAMQVFWAKGYEGATLTDLQEVMGGLAPPSLYAAFGSKERLFREAVDLYNQMYGAAVVTALNDGATARAAVEGYLRTVVRIISQSRGTRGCLITLGDINCMSENHAVKELLREFRLLTQKKVRQRLKRGVTEGDMPEGAAVGAIAAFCTAIADGLAIQARDGASVQALHSVVDTAMAGWSKLVSPPRAESGARRVSR